MDCHISLNCGYHHRKTYFGNLSPGDIDIHYCRYPSGPEYYSQDNSAPNKKEERWQDNKEDKTRDPFPDNYRPYTAYFYSSLFGGSGESSYPVLFFSPDHSKFYFLNGSKLPVCFLYIIVNRIIGTYGILCHRASLPARRFYNGRSLSEHFIYFRNRICFCMHFCACCVSFPYDHVQINQIIRDIYKNKYWTGEKGQAEEWICTESYTRY